MTHDFTPERENHSTPAPWFRILSLTGGLNPTQANDGFLVVMEKKMEATRDKGGLYWDDGKLKIIIQGYRGRECFSNHLKLQVVH